MRKDKEKRNKKENKKEKVILKNRLPINIKLLYTFINKLKRLFMFTGQPDHLTKYIFKYHIYNLRFVER